MFASWTRTARSSFAETCPHPPTAPSRLTDLPWEQVTFIPRRCKLWNSNIMQRFHCLGKTCVG